jgi:GNAT superfamily N-acetyltransferase
MVTIQPFEPNDRQYEAVTAIENAVWPDYSATVEAFKHGDQSRDPNDLFQRLVVKEGQQIVAFGEYQETPWSHQPGKYEIDLTVHPDYERHGIGAVLYEQMMTVLAKREPKPGFITSSTREHKPQAIRFLEKRGFQQVMRVPESRLDISVFDPVKFSAVAEQVQAQGIKIYTIPELQAIDPNWQQNLYELDWICIQDEPSPDPPTKQPLEQFVKQFLGHPDFMAEAWFIALDGSQYVGLTGLFKNQTTEDQLDSGFTGVLPEYRRRGVATALKLRAIEFARRYGAKTIKTSNEENNPMYKLNLDLGFKRTSAWLAYKKMIDSTNGEF